MFETKFVNFASFICLFGQTHNSNSDTLCSRVCAFAFCINSLHQLVMLGPKEPYHKKHSPEKVGESSFNMTRGGDEDIETRNLKF